MKMSNSAKCGLLLSMLLIVCVEQYALEPVNVNLKSLLSQIESNPIVSGQKLDLNSFVDNFNQLSQLANTLNANNINIADLSNTVNNLNALLNNNNLNLNINDLNNVLSSLTQAGSTLNINNMNLSSLSNALNSIGQLLTPNSNMNPTDVANYLQTINQLMTYLNLKPADLNNVLSSINLFDQLYQSVNPMNVTNLLVLLQNKQVFDQILQLGNLGNILNKTALENLINQIATIASMNETMLEQTFSVDNVLTFLNITMYKGTFLQLLSQLDNLTSIVNDLNDNLNNLTALMTGFAQYANIAGLDFMSGLLDMNTNVRNCIANLIADQTSGGSTIKDPCTMFTDQAGYTALLNYLTANKLDIQTIINNQVAMLNKSSSFLNDTNAILSKVDTNDLTNRVQNSLMTYLGMFVKQSLIQPNETLPTLPPTTPVSLTTTTKNGSTHQTFSYLTVLFTTLLGAFTLKKLF